MTCVSLTGYSFHVWLPTSTNLLFQGGFNVYVSMSTCFVLTLSCLRAGLCGGWVSDLVGCGGSTCGERKFYWICRPLICNFTEHVTFLRVFFMYFAEADYLPGFCVDRCPGGKGLIVTWRQILNCDMTRESMHLGERGRAYTHMCVYICVHADMHVCAHVVVHMCICMHASKQFLIACKCA